MAQGFFEITDNWTAQNFSEGQWSIKLQNTNATLLVSESSNGEVVFNSKDFNNGVIPLNVVAQQDFYFKVVGDIDNAKVFYSDAFFFRVGGGGGNYTFTAPLVDTQSNISIALSQSLKVTQDRLDLNLTANTDFRNALLGIDEAKKIATYTSVGRVMPKEHHFQLNALSGELELDLSSTGVLSQNFASIQTTVTTDTAQTISGAKTLSSPLTIQSGGNELLKLVNPNSNTSNYIAGYEGNTRIYYIGKDSSSSIDLSIKNEYSVNGWITLKTKSKFDQAYTITDNEQIVHKKYVDDTINTNCVKLTGTQTIDGDKTFSGFSKFINAIDIDTAPSSISDFIMRFVGDKWPSGQSADLIRFHKYGKQCGYRVYLNGTGFGYAEIFGLTLISNMKDPTEDSHGANKRYVDTSISAKTGTLADLTTTDKTNLVSAINEVKADIPKVLPSGTQPTTTNIGNMQVAFVLK